jgi:phosphoglycerate dehydrogenase-like enzyme
VSLRLRVVLAGGSGDDIAGRLAERLPGSDVVNVARPEHLADALVDADAVVCNRLTPEDTRDARRLRLVQATSAGADRVDPAALPPGCTLCNAYAHEDAIAEWVLMSVLALTRHLLAYDRGLRSGEWNRDLPLERELRGRVLGTIGYGHIGRRVVELGRAFGMDALAVTRTPTPERSVRGG